jgi:hypothetical protein
MLFQCYFIDYQGHILCLHGEATSLNIFYTSMDTRGHVDVTGLGGLLPSIYLEQPCVQVGLVTDLQMTNYQMTTMIHNPVQGAVLATSVVLGT